MNTACLFCKIAAGTLSSDKVYEDDEVVAFKDIHPIAPIHILIVPRTHIPSVAELQEGDERLVGEMVRRAKLLATEQGIAETGYRLVFNIRAHAGQVIDHIHLHLIGGKPLGRMA